MGVRRVPGTDGATMGPPADRLYAVEPDGVAMISPSACSVYSMQGQEGREEQRTNGVVLPVTLHLHVPQAVLQASSAQMPVEEVGMLVMEDDIMESTIEQRLLDDMCSRPAQIARLEQDSWSNCE